MSCSLYYYYYQLTLSWPKIVYVMPADSQNKQVLNNFFFLNKKVQQNCKIPLKDQNTKIKLNLYSSPE